jgi:hypothetical protein
MHYLRPPSFLSLPRYPPTSSSISTSLTNGQPPAITPAAVVPKFIARQDTAGIKSCMVYYNLFDSCSSRPPTIISPPFVAAASCYGYSGTSYVPDPYDLAYDTCLSYYKTGNPAPHFARARRNPAMQRLGRPRSLHRQRADPNYYFWGIQTSAGLKAVFASVLARLPHAVLTLLSS